MTWINWLVAALVQRYFRAVLTCGAAIVAAARWARAS